MFGKSDTFVRSIESDTALSEDELTKKIKDFLRNKFGRTKFEKNEENKSVKFKCGGFFCSIKGSFVVKIKENKARVTIEPEFSMGFLLSVFILLLLAVLPLAVALFIMHIMSISQTRTEFANAFAEYGGVFVEYDVI